MLGYLGQAGKPDLPFRCKAAASDGEYPLLGTLLLDGHHLDLNYGAKTVELT